MYRLTDIQDSLLHLVGWRQSLNPQAQIDASLTRTESGIYYQGAHPLLTLDAVRSVMPDNWGWQYPEWDGTAQYHTGDVVRYGGGLWQALQDSIGETPGKGDYDGSYNDDYGNPYWVSGYYPFSDFLTRLVKDGISNMVQSFLQIKSLNRQFRPLLERLALFDGAGRINSLVDNQEDMCGFEIVPVRGMGVTAKIERIGLQMRGSGGNVTVYLFHSSMPDPVKTAQFLVPDGRGLFQWFDVEDWYLPYIGGNNAGGAWYLCYDQSELPTGMVAVNLARDLTKEPCGSCNHGNAQQWREFRKYLQAVPFKTAPNGGQLWDIEDNIYTPTVSYGMNFEISVGCDLTDFIISQRQMFANVLQKQVAYDALRLLAMNPGVRVNRIQSNADKADILYELDGNPQGRESGLGKQLRDAYEALRIDTAGLDRICLPCRNVGVRYTCV